MEKFVRGFLIALALGLSLSVMAGCSSTSKNATASSANLSQAEIDARFEDNDYQVEQILLPDPLYPWNRFWFTFNDYVYSYVARPIYNVYDFITPTPVKRSVTNFFHNLMFPVRFVNSLLQFKFMQAGVEMSRFVLNTTYGIGGLFDPASGKKAIVATDNEDFGQTLGVWGVGEGFYLVLPLIGPSTARDAVGLVGDHFMDPVSYHTVFGVNYPYATTATITASGVREGNNLGDRLRQYDELKKSAVDPYASMRDAYIQYRRNRVVK